MTSTATMPSRLRERRKPASEAVPLLLSSFPIPPSHIPPSPFVTAPSPGINPPPSLPPSTPLPPVPGPSPISEHDTLMFISATRSRRASKLSLASSSSFSRRDSTATVASFASSTSGGPPSLSPSFSVTPLDSTFSLRSYSSNGSLSVPSPSRFLDKFLNFSPRINEEATSDIGRTSTDDISSHSSLPEHTDDEKVSEMMIPPSFTRRHGTSDSISSIDLRDLPSLNDDPPQPSPPLSASGVVSTPRPSFAAHPKPLSPSTDKALPPLPRSYSPDISTILATTPRPRRKSAVSSRDRSSSRPRSSVRRRVSEGAALVDSSSRRTSASSRTTGRTKRSQSPSELPYARGAEESFQDDSFVSDYGVLLDRTGTAVEIFDEEEEVRLERELEGNGSDTDSSLDIHTPLPNLMLRDGLLSPNSKILPQSSRSSSPIANGRPGSIISVASSTASFMTKSGIYKDQRDTVKRRHRHRDGKLLRGGIGLTTGLGWSDSEDEGAPSPLTRRLSSLTLQSKASTSSLTSQPTMRSFSAAVPDSLYLDELTATRMYGSKSRPSVPPTSWQKHTAPLLDRRTSTSSTVSSASSGFSIPPRASVSSLRSVSSSSRLVNTSSSAPLEHIKEREEYDVPSSSSCGSIPMPKTPVGNDDYSPSAFLPQKTLKSSLSSRPFPSSTSTSSTTSRTSGPRPLRLPQSQAHTQSVRPAASEDRLSSISSSRSTPAVGEFGQAQRARAISAGSLPRPRVSSTSKVARPPMPSSTGSAASGSSSSVSAAIPQRSASLGSPSAQAKQKPRTGTGMSYRTSSSSASSLSARPSLMRPPSGPALKMARSEVGIAL